MTQKNYTQEYDWTPVDEMKGWEEPNQPDHIHKVTVVEHETGDENRIIFNFSPSQTSDPGRWKKAVDRRVQQMLEAREKNPSVLE